MFLLLMLLLTLSMKQAKTLIIITHTNINKQTNNPFIYTHRILYNFVVVATKKKIRQNVLIVLFLDDEIFHLFIYNVANKLMFEEKEKYRASEKRPKKKININDNNPMMILQVNKMTKHWFLVVNCRCLLMVFFSFLVAKI